MFPLSYLFIDPTDGSAKRDCEWATIKRIEPRAGSATDFNLDSRKVDKHVICDFMPHVLCRLYMLANYGQPQSFQASKLNKNGTVASICVWVVPF